MANGNSLASWILARPSFTGGPITHLKLQKLAFYCYGGAAAADLESGLGSISFEAWKHGPVCREVYESFAVNGANPLPFAASNVRYSAPVEDVLSDVLGVYGRLDAWSLRHQSHLEQPWLDAFNRSQATIEPSQIKAHFKAKFAAGRVVCPDYLVDSGGLRLDRIPVRTFPSLKALAAALRS